MPGNPLSVWTDLIKIDHSRNASIDHNCPTEGNNDAKPDGILSVIESRSFLRECIRQSMRSAFAKRVETYSSVLDFENRRSPGAFGLIILSLSEESVVAATDALWTLSVLAPNVPVVVLSDESDLELARAVIAGGAKGYIPVTMGFEMAVEAVRFVFAGGTYVPADLFVTRDPPEVALQHRTAFRTVTARELAVVRGIQQGKPNKIIASELSVCESTVKVHVRHIMKKLAAKNRTDVAIKSARILGT